MSVAARGLCEAGQLTAKKLLTKVWALQFLWGTKIREKRMLAKLKTTISLIDGQF